MCVYVIFHTSHATPPRRDNRHHCGLETPTEARHCTRGCHQATGLQASTTQLLEPSPLPPAHSEYLLHALPRADCCGNDTGLSAPRGWGGHLFCLPDAMPTQDMLSDLPHYPGDTLSSGRRMRPRVYEARTSSCLEPGSSFQTKRWLRRQALKKPWVRKNILEEG